VKKNEYGEGFADTFIHRADQLIEVARIRLDLAAARQRVDRALLALGESTYKLAVDKEHPHPLPSELEGVLERVKRSLNDCERLQERLDKVRERWREE